MAPPRSTGTPTYVVGGSRTPTPSGGSHADTPAADPDSYEEETLLLEGPCENCGKHAVFDTDNNTGAKCESCPDKVFCHYQCLIDGYNRHKATEDHTKHRKAKKEREGRGK